MVVKGFVDVRLTFRLFLGTLQRRNHILRMTLKRTSEAKLLGAWALLLGCVPQQAHNLPYQLWNTHNPGTCETGWDLFFFTTKNEKNWKRWSLFLSYLVTSQLSKGSFSSSKQRLKCQPLSWRSFQLQSPFSPGLPFILVLELIHEEGKKGAAQKLFICYFLT